MILQSSEGTIWNNLIVAVAAFVLSLAPNKVNRVRAALGLRTRTQAVASKATRSAHMEHLDTQQTEVAIAGGSLLESIEGIGAIVLAILAIIRVLPGILGPIATIAIGTALLAEGGVFGAPLVARAGTSVGRTRPRIVGTAAGIGTFAGAAGVALGIIALLGLERLTLMAVAAIVFGAALLMSGAGTSAIGRFAARETTDTSVAETMLETAETIAGSRALAGIGAATLGILALVGLAPQLLVMIALLAVAGALLMSSAATASAMAYVREH
jgi:hypothetical protein